MSKRHVIKHTHKQGKELQFPTLWCGNEKARSDGWIFQDAQHVALAVGGSIAPCKKCIKAIIKQLNEELM